LTGPAIKVFDLVTVQTPPQMTRNDSQVQPEKGQVPQKRVKMKFIEIFVGFWIENSLKN